MDNDSPESKEVDEALLAQCTCGGVKRCLPCTATCAIFAGCNPFTKPELGEPFKTGLALEEPHAHVATLLVRKCPSCGSFKLREIDAESETAVSDGEATAFIRYQVKATVCDNCGEGVLDSRAEDAEMQAHLAHLRGKIKSLRQLNGSQQLELEHHRAFMRLAKDAMRQLGPYLS